VGPARLEHKLVRVALAIGAAVRLARIVFSRPERGKLDAAVRALDAASVRGVDGLEYQPALRGEWTR
jgi:hypothetical protein